MGGSVIFDLHVGIDYSGAGTADERLSGLRVFATTEGGDPQEVFTPYGRKGAKRWTRGEVYRFCETAIVGDQRVIIGIDHAFGFPMQYLNRVGNSTWDAFLDDFARRWPATGQGVTVESLRSSNALVEDRAALRLCECWTAGAKSVFWFDVQGSVAKSTRAGIPWLQCMRRDAALCEMVHFWPFDGFKVPEGRSVIAEVYPSLFAKRYAKDDRTGDQQDAYATARWLAEMDRCGQLVDRYFSPPLSEAEQQIARVEGWILGVA